MIIEIVDNEHRFRDAFREMGRGEQFSHDALGLLFDYLDQLSDDCGQQIELDVVGICCDYVEDNAYKIAIQYDIDIENLNDDEIIEEVVAILEINGVFVGKTADDSIVYRQF
jgi:hypothetical protein